MNLYDKLKPDMKANGIIEFEIESEKVFLTFDGSQNAFIDFYNVVLKPLTLVNAKTPDNFNLVKATYYDKVLTDEELIKLTSP